MRVLAALMLAMLPGLAPAAAQDRSLHTASVGRIEWTGGQPTSGVASARTSSFAVAMLQYRQAALADWKAGPYPILDEKGATSGNSMVWLAADGSHVEKVRQGLFRLTVPEAQTGWFRSIDCHADEWPAFLCADGRKRTMSVPSATRLVFDGTRFDKLEPPVPTGLAEQ
ncbi:MAG: hypothetical protein KF849_00740 [Rhizobiaceae bacterium]|nr:hypothetical protein [Rhizobiaceae bacterium]